MADNITLRNIEHETMRDLCHGDDAAVRRINKHQFKIEFENETEDWVDVVIRPKLASGTGKSNR